MLSNIAGLFKGEMSRAASTFQAAQSRFLSLLEAYKEKVPGEAPAADAPAAEAAEAPAAEARADESPDEAPAAEVPVAESPDEVSGGEEWKD